MYTTQDLGGVIEALDRPRSFLLDTFFSEVVTFDTEEIFFDKIPGGVRLAPFVSPLVPGRAAKTKPYQTDVFKPAYVKPKDLVKPATALRRRPGEAVGGAMSPQERLDAGVADILEIHQRTIIARKEWMAVQALVSGAVTVVGDDYPSTTVSFGRDAALSIALTGGNRWGQAGVVPSDTIETWVDLAQEKSSTPITDIVLEPGALKLLRADDKFTKALDNRRGGEGSIELTMTNAGDTVSQARFLGTIGDLNFWAYQWAYEAEDGTLTKMIPANSVIGVSRAVEGKQLHGAIQDVSALAAAEFYPKTWIENDPPVLFAMTQSAPLVAPLRPNASFYALVNQ